MLTQLLGCDALRDDVERHIPGLIRAINHLDQTRYDLVLADGEKGAAWASGHHPQIRGPESWSTASVYHFLHLMERFLSRLLRKELFIRLKADPRPLSATPVPIADFAKSMLDSEIEIADGKTSSLKDAIRDRFLKPLVENRKLVQNGKPFKTAGAKIEMSMLMFGPPGTSKTTLAEDIAKVMGWPLLKVDPSHILIEGWDRVHAAAIRLLDDLAELDEVVVLLDEFDELVRTRGKEHDDPISRFFTTAMLPKLIKLNEERRIVLLMATNYVDKFDAAITREGRFDKVVQVMPPSAVAKVQKWRAINLHFEIQNHDKLKDLSFSESLRLAKDLEGVSDKGEAIGILERHHGKCTLSKSEGEKGMTWKELCAKQKDRIRI